MQPFSRRDVTLATWRAAPYSRWSFQHVNELVPCATVSEPRRKTMPPGPSLPAIGVESVELFHQASESLRGPPPSIPPLKGEGGRSSPPLSPSPLRGGVRGGGILPGIKGTLPGSRGPGKAGKDKPNPVPLVTWLETSHCDSLVVMREGAVVGEWHAPRVDPALPHVVFSVTKSVTGMLAGIAHADGALDVEAPVSRYVPVPRESAYARATVRDLLDMTVDLDFDEAYEDHGGAFDRYRRAMLWNPERAGTAPETMEAFLASLGTREDHHGARHLYASPNTDMMGLVIERATGMRFHSYLAEKLWRPMGALDGACITVDREGTARAAGGLCVTARDLALFGQLVLDGGKSRAEEQLIPRAWIADMRKNGSRAAWADGDSADMFPGGAYRSCWYLSHDDHDSFCAIGIHGQYLWVDPVTRTIIARTGSRPEASDDAAVHADLAALRRLARSL